MESETTQLLLLHSNFFHQQKVCQSMDHDNEFRESVVQTMELKLKIRDQQISHLNHLLAIAIQERNLAQQNCQKLVLDNLLLQSSTPRSGISSAGEEPTNAFSPSDCDESIVSSPASDLHVAIDGPLPEQGNLLQAVMSAGPLLQTLLVSGPMPQWRHPPPPLDAAYQIPPPPVAIPNREAAINFSNCGKGLNRRKRGFCEGSESSSVEFKYQRVLH